MVADVRHFVVGGHPCLVTQPDADHQLALDGSSGNGAARRDPLGDVDAARARALPRPPPRQPLRVSVVRTSAVAPRSGKVPSDAALVIEAQRGSTWAMGTLLRRHVPRVHAIALALIGRDADIDDLVQESFAQAVQSIGKLKAPSAFGSWLSAIVVSTAGKTFRRRRLLTRVGLTSRDPLEIEIENLTAP